MFSQKTSRKKESFSPVLLFYGAETNLMEEEVKRIIEKNLKAKCKSFNLSYFQGENCSPGEIINASRTPPFLDQLRIVVVTDFEKFSAEKSKTLLPYIKSPSTKTLLLLTGSNVKKTTSVFKALQTKKWVRPFYPMKPNQVVSWIRRKVKENGQEIEMEAAWLIVERVEPQTQFLLPELEKLRLYTLGRQIINLQDTMRVISNIKTFNLFELSEAVGKREREKALTILYKIFREGGVPLVLLSMILRQFRLIWWAKLLFERNAPRSEIIGKLKIPPFVLDNIKSQISMFSSDDLKRIFFELHKIDMVMKSGVKNQERYLENFIINTCDSS